MWLFAVSMRLHSLISANIGSDRCSLNPPSCCAFSFLSPQTPAPGRPAESEIDFLVCWRAAERLDLSV